MIGYSLIMSDSRKYIVGNWKMHGTRASAEALVTALQKSAQATAGKAEVVICPPATLLRDVAAMSGGSNLRIGAQDTSHVSPEGAHTGDISALMVKDAGAAFVIVGHSERRQQHGETSALVRQKAEAAIAGGLIPIICIGERADERDSGNAREVVGIQVVESLPKKAGKGQFLLAYEPVWAIGSGKTPTRDEIREMHTYIKSAASTHTGLAPAQIHVLYGGSVKADNAKEILSIDEVSGVLVGGASLKPDEFDKIIKAAV